MLHIYAFFNILITIDFVFATLSTVVASRRVKTHAEAQHAHLLFETKVSYQDFMTKVQRRALTAL